VSTSRLESFSDGVLSVAITLLSFNLAIRGPGHGTLVDQLGQRWPSFAAYLVSFLVIGIIWVNHHSLFGQLVSIDRAVLVLNLLLLLFVVLIPFATATMAEYLLIGGTDSHVAAAIYAGVLEGMGITFAAIYLWSRRQSHFHEKFGAESNRAALSRFSMGSFAYLIAIGCAFVNAAITLVIVALVAIYYAFEQIGMVTESNAE
jgi:TMEM175 potassium channel family protein